MSKCSNCIYADVVGWAEHEMIDICRLGNDIESFDCEDKKEQEENDNSRRLF